MPRRLLAECTPAEIAERAHVQVAFGRLPADDILRGLEIVWCVRDKKPIFSASLAWLFDVEFRCEGGEDYAQAR